MQLGAGDAEQVGEAAAKGDGEPAPQFGGVPVERDLPGVVVAVRAQRGAEVGVVVAVDAGAVLGPAVRAERGPAAAGVAGLAGAAGGVHPPERRRGQGDEVPADGLAIVSGTSLMPPAVPA